MHWVVDRSLGRRNALGQGGEAGYEALMVALKQSGTPYTLVRKIPFSGDLIDPDDESRDPKRITLDLNGPVYVCGTMAMNNTAREHGWSPGYIDAPDQQELIDQWGHHMLNYHAVIGRFADIQPPADDFFARPVDDSKSIAGTVFKRADFEEWRERVMRVQGSDTTIQADDRFMMAPIQKIYAEYRLYVLDGVIATGSRYKLGSRVFYTTDLDPSMLDFARRRIAEFCPRRALCLDIAHVEGPQPYKVIETNAISSAGFYACDMQIFVNSMNGMFDE